MAYKTLFNNSFHSTLLRQEKFIKKELLAYKSEKRKYDFANGEIGRKLLKDRKDIEKLFPFFRYSEYFETFQDRENLYSNDSMELVLENEIKELFDNGLNFGVSDYNIFIEQFAIFMGLEESRKNFGAQNWLNELYYEFDEIDKVSLEEIKNIKEHFDYIRLTKIKYPGSHLIDKKTKSSKINKKFILPNLNEDERILLNHYLTRDNLFNKVDMAKIMALMNKPILSSTSIFNEETRKNEYYNKLRRGYDYYGAGKGEDLLNSLLIQVKPYKIVKLNSAIKMDLNKILNDKINKKNF